MGSYKSIDFYQKAADAGDANAMYHVGICYQFGRSVERNYSKAVEWYQKAADAGNVDAMNNLGVLYAEGRYIKQDYDKAFALFQKSAKTGDPGSANNLGKCYLQGLGVSQDYKKAVECFMQGAAGLDNNALRNLAYCYRNGLGVEKDPFAADKCVLDARYYSKEWLRERIRKAESGDFDASYYLGSFYLASRTSFLHNREKALDLFQRAGQNAHSGEEMYKLGEEYQDYDYYAEALRWYLRAANAGDDDAVRYGVHGYHANMIWQSKAIDPIVIYQEEAEAGNVFAMYDLAELYEDGYRVKRDRAKARMWYQKAAEAGNEQAKKKIQKEVR